VKQEFLKFMAECGALLFGDFTLKSGRKSPYFINTGEYKYNDQISKLGEFYRKLVQNSVRTVGKSGGIDEKLEGNELSITNGLIRSKFNVLFGPSYKGIPLATMLAVKLSEIGVNVGVSYDRKERKSHGESNSILGYVPKDGDKIAIVEDVTTAGTSVREIIALLEAQNIDAKITSLYVSIDRMEKGTGEMAATRQISDEYGIEVYSIATTKDIIEYLECTPTDHPPVPNGIEYAKKMREYLEQYGAV
jgi:orotate phosphoribosyltransferase